MTTTDQTDQPLYYRAPVQVDRVRLIRRSLRCFIFGLLGVIPLIGLGPALVALRLHRQVALESGDYYGVARIVTWWLIGLLAIPAYYLTLGFAGAVLMAGLTVTVQASILWSHYRTSQAREWNPARNYLYWGVGLAYTGLFGLLSLMELPLLQTLEKSLAP